MIKKIKLKEWQCHIPNPYENEKHLSLCGEKLSPFEFHFTDIDHAFCAIPTSRLQPCPAKVIEIFQSAE